jgi:hypothetical protein
METSYQNTFRMLGVNFHADLLKMVELNFVEKNRICKENNCFFGKEEY